jgi:hypothetical protein
MLLVANRLGKVEIAVRASGYTESADEEAPETVLATWASDVSPALKSIKRLAASGSAVASAAPAAPARPPASAGPAPSASPAGVPRQPTEVMHGSKLEVR